MQPGLFGIYLGSARCSRGFIRLLMDGGLIHHAVAAFRLALIEFGIRLGNGRLDT